MDVEGEPILRVSRLAFSFDPPRVFLGPLDADFARGRLHAVVGPNGAGKSTLLRLLVGLCAPRRGAVRLEGRALESLSARERARRIAFVTQHPFAPEGLNAEEIVCLGRHPHRGLGLFESPEDLAVARQAMRMTGVEGFRGRRMETLSGGEAQRVHLAGALAQEPTVLALDEPTSQLDLYHQLSIFDLLRRLARERGLCVIVVTHDLNLAARYADEILLLSGGQLVARGEPKETLTPANLEPVYRVRFASVAAPVEGGRWLIAQHTTPSEPPAQARGPDPKARERDALPLRGKRQEDDPRGEAS